jgi:predicted nuclease with TOPRIM domain
MNNLNLKNELLDKLIEKLKEKLECYRKIARLNAEIKKIEEKIQKLPDRE